MQQHPGSSSALLSAASAMSTSIAPVTVTATPAASSAAAATTTQEDSDNDSVKTAVYTPAQEVPAVSSASSASSTAATTSAISSSTSAMPRYDIDQEEEDADTAASIVSENTKTSPEVGEESSSASSATAVYEEEKYYPLELILKFFKKIKPAIIKILSAEKEEDLLNKLQDLCKSPDWIFINIFLGSYHMSGIKKQDCPYLIIKLELFIRSLEQGLKQGLENLRENYDKIQVAFDTAVKAATKYEVLGSAVTSVAPVASVSSGCIIPAFWIGAFSPSVAIRVIAPVENGENKNILHLAELMFPALQGCIESILGKLNEIKIADQEHFEKTDYFLLRRELQTILKYLFINTDLMTALKKIESFKLVTLKGIERRFIEGVKEVIVFLHPDVESLVINHISLEDCFVKVQECWKEICQVNSVSPTPVFSFAFATPTSTSAVPVVATVPPPVSNDALTVGELQELAKEFFKKIWSKILPIWHKIFDTVNAESSTEKDNLVEQLRNGLNGLFEDEQWKVTEGLVKILASSPYVETQDNKLKAYQLLIGGIRIMSQDGIGYLEHVLFKVLGALKEIYLNDRVAITPVSSSAFATPTSTSAASVIAAAPSVFSPISFSRLISFQVSHVSLFVRPVAQPAAMLPLAQNGSVSSTTVATTSSSASAFSGGGSGSSAAALLNPSLTLKATPDSSSEQHLIFRPSLF